MAQAAAIVMTARRKATITPKASVKTAPRTTMLPTVTIRPPTITGQGDLSGGSGLDTSGLASTDHLSGKSRGPTEAKAICITIESS
jgi:hypothetical protein